jgi:glycosyltransferase involved in cell wall biosynthesis
VTAVASSINKLLTEAGIETKFISGDYPSGGYHATSARRVFFNLRLSRQKEISNGGPIVAFDFDGFAFPKKTRFISINQGLLADIVQFESGAVRGTLRILAALEAIAVKKAEKVFTPSRFAADRIMSLYGVPANKLEVVPNGIFADGDEASNPIAPSKTAVWSGASPLALQPLFRPTQALCVAKLYKRKGVALLLEAWAEVVKAVPGGTFLKIVGNGLEYERLKRMTAELGIDKTVTFLGDIDSRPGLAQVYRECDLFCLPSLHETFGLVYLEAMAAGKPIVALNSTAVPELVRNGVDGLLTEPDVKSLSRAIIILLTNKVMRDKMGQAGRKRAFSEFFWNKTASPLVDYISRW